MKHSRICLGMVSAALLPFAEANCQAPASELKPRRVFRSWDVQDGLPAATVTGIAQCRDGFLWMATFAGLVRFDGRQFDVFHLGNTPAMTTNRLLCVHRDQADRLWVGTHGGGALIRDVDGRIRRLDSGSKAPRREVYGAIAEEPDGTVWLGGKGLVRHSSSGVQYYSQVPGLPPEAQVRSLCVAASGALWIGTDKGLVRYHAGRFERLSATWIFAFAADHAGRIWVFARDGLHVFVEGKRACFFPEVLKGPLAVRIADGEIWVTYSSTRTYRFVRGRIEFVREFGARPWSAVWCYFVDAGGQLWVGGGWGLARINRVATEFLTHYVLAGPTGQPGFEAWVGFQDVFELSRAGVRRQARERFELGVRIAATDRMGRQWFGGQRGAVCLDAQGGRTRVGAGLGVTRGFFEDSVGAMWIGTDRGLVRRAGDRLETLDRGDGPYGRVVQAPDGAIWALAGSGVLRVEGDQVRRYRREQGVPHGELRGLHVDQVGVAWVAGYGGGMCRIDGDQVFRIGAEHGLLDESLSCILEDDKKRLWINSNRGVMVVHRHELNALATGGRSSVRCRLATTREANGPVGFRDVRGKMWFSVVGGFMVLDPEKLAPNDAAPRVRLVEVRVAGAKVPDPRRRDPLDLQVPPGTRNIEFEFTGIALTQTESVTFRYRLVGYDEAWVDAGTRRIAVYAQVPPGSYRLEVQASNTDGVWTAPVHLASLTQIPALYQRRWVQWLGLALILVALVFLHRWRLVHVRKRNVALRQEIQERLAAQRVVQDLRRRLVQAEEEERGRIARELHDDLTQRLAALALKVGIMEASPEQNPALARLREEIEAVSQDVHRLSRRLHPTVIDDLGLADALRSECRARDAATDLEVQCEVDELPELLEKDVCLALYRVCQEAISNALRHGQGSFVRVALQSENRTVRVEVEDDGCGFLVEGQRFGLGLASMRERIEIVGGQLTIESTPGQGTRVLASVPISAG